MDSVRTNQYVEYVEEDRILTANLTPTDPLFNQQWHYSEAPAGINAPKAWDVTIGTGITVGVLDTGYRPHVDLASNIVGGYDFINDVFKANDGDGRDSSALDPGDSTAAGACFPGSPSTNSSWHGTHVAGTVAAVTNNGIGVSGVAFGAKIVPIRVLGRCGGFISDIADGMIWAAGGSVSGVPPNSNRARVLNLSLGGAGTCPVTLQSAVNSARALGTVVVVAAGNGSADASNTTPANCAGVVTVAAVNRMGGRAWYSNFGGMVDVAAPGGDTPYALT